MFILLKVADFEAKAHFTTPQEPKNELLATYPIAEEHLEKRDAKYLIKS